MPKTKKATKKKTQKVKLGFAPKQVTKRLLSAIPERAQDILTKRYGLGAKTEPMTLEAIGQQYGITRERVRQIENYSLSSIHKSSAYDKEEKAFDELEHVIDGMGVIVPEAEFLKSVSSDQSVQNHLHFLLVLGHPFVYEKETTHFTHRWHVNEKIARQVETALQKLYESLPEEDLMQEPDLIVRFLDHLKELSDQYRDEEVLRRWLSLSKVIDKNPLGHWGRADSPNVSLRGMRDYSYLVIREHGSPLHFAEVARRITDMFDKQAHTATVHNELIKDSRFVLVGRGLYALTEWGYMQGVVRDVITEVLKKNGPMTRDEIIDKVLKERYVKQNTIAVNLQDGSMFKKTKDGRYALV